MIRDQESSTDSLIPVVIPRAINVIWNSCRPLALQWILSLVQSVPSLRESWVSLILFFLPPIDHAMKLLIAILQLLAITCIAKSLDNSSASFIYANHGLNWMATGGEDNIHEYGEMWSFSSTITIQVSSDAHLNCSHSYLVMPLTSLRKFPSACNK